MEQPPKCADLYPPNPNKDNAPVDPLPLDPRKTKNNKDPKYKERKYALLAGLKRKSSTTLETIPETHEWYYPDQTTKQHLI